MSANATTLTASKPSIGRRAIRRRHLPPKQTSTPVSIGGALAATDIALEQQARKKTIVFVTHNVREAACLADRVVLFSPHPGRIREQFNIDLARPRENRETSG